MLSGWLHKIIRPELTALCRPAGLSVRKLDLPPDVGARKMGKTPWTADHLHFCARRIREQPIILDARRRAEIQPSQDDGMISGLQPRA